MPREKHRGQSILGVAGFDSKLCEVNLLLDAIRARARRDEQDRAEVRERLRSALAELLPGKICWLYGSVTRPGRFRDWSDVDLALECFPADGASPFLLASLLGERVGRHVDLVSLEETRLREKILREGERWTT